MTDATGLDLAEINRLAADCASSPENRVGTIFRLATQTVPALTARLTEVAADHDRARDVAVALEQELAEVRSAFREVLDLHEQPPREDAEGVYPWFSGDIGVDEMAGYRALLDLDGA